MTPEYVALNSTIAESGASVVELSPPFVVPAGWVDIGLSEVLG